MSKSPNSDIIDKIYFRNIYSCQRKIYWYKVKVMETINAVWEHSYGEDCIPNFSANMEQPRHRWYEFKEGFSLTLVERAIRETKKDNKSTSFTVLDPFSGSGTSPLTALQSRCNAIGYEVNPFMSFVGKTKCQQRTKSIHDYTKELNRILVQRPFRLKSPLEGVSTFTGSGENGKWLFNLDVLRAYEALYQHISLSEYKDFFLLALITSAMQCCNAKKDGKCLRYLKNWKALNYTGANLRDTFKANALQMISDLERSPLLEGTRDITQGDTRKLLQASEHDSADLIIFSPPYLNSMLYLAELLSIYDGCNAQKWGYGFARNKYGAPVSIELMEEVEFLCAKGYLSKDSSGYYRISDTASLNSILSISKSGILGWRSKYIEVVFDSLLTKSFPRVVRAVQNEPGISLLESINRTSTLLESSLINALYEDFGVLKEIIGDPQIDLVVPASLWIDYLSVQKQ